MRRLMEMYGLNAETAGKQVCRADQRQNAYLRFYTGRHYDAASNYHLCLNASVLGINLAVAAAISALVISI